MCHLGRFGAMPKNHHFWTPSRWTKKSSLGAPRAEQKVPGASPRVSFLARRVRGAASRAWTSGEKNDRGAEEQLVQDLTRHGPMARRNFYIYISERGGAEWRILLLGALGWGVLVWDFSVCLCVCLSVPGWVASDPPWRPTLGDPPWATHPGRPARATHPGDPPRQPTPATHPQRPPLVLIASLAGVRYSHIAASPP